MPTAFKEVSSKDFGGLEKLLEAKPSMLLIYAEWCGHCQHFEPVWKAFAAKVAKDDSLKGKVQLVRIEDAVLRKLAAADVGLYKRITKGAVYYPKLVVFSKGKPAYAHEDKDGSPLPKDLDTLVAIAKGIASPKTKAKKAKAGGAASKDAKRPKASKAINEQIHGTYGASAKDLPRLIDQMIAKYLGL